MIQKKDMHKVTLFQGPEVNTFFLQKGLVASDLR